MFTVLSFLNCSKNPPSLLFLLMTLGVAVLLLAVFDREPGPVGKVLVMFGRVPLAFYIWHLVLLHAAQVGWHFLMGQRADGGEDLNWTLSWTYLAWLLTLGLLYLPCRWFAEVKRQRRDWWLTYC